MNPSHEDNFDDSDPFADDSEADFAEIERRMNIGRLKNEFRQITGVTPDANENPDAPSEVVEGFWNYVNEWETAPDTTQTAQWERDHAPLPPDSQLDDAGLTTLLFQLVAWMATRREYLEDTDHLSDRELYRFLREESMDDWTKEFPPGSQTNTHISPIGSGSEEDTAIYLRFYADEQWREWWAKDWSEDFIPPRETPPYDRDAHLPKVDYRRDLDSEPPLTPQHIGDFGCFGGEKLGFGRDLARCYARGISIVEALVSTVTPSASAISLATRSRSPRTALSSPA